MTLTRAALVQTRSLMLTITGQRKRMVTEGAIRDGPLSNLAIGRVLASASVPVEVYWSWSAPGSAKATDVRRWNS